MRALLYYFAIGWLTTAHLPAQEIMTLDGDFIQWINPKDGSIIRTGWALGAPAGWTGLAKSPTGPIVGAAGSTFPFIPFGIYEIDPVTGHTRFIVQTALDGITAISFGPGASLYALRDPSRGWGGPMDLLRIDLATGSSTVIGSTGFTLSDNLVFGQGFFWTYHGGRDGLGLIRIDPATATSVDVNPGIRGPSDLLDSLCFSDDGVLYLLDYGLWILDLETGVPTFVDFIPGVPLLTCAEFVPNQPDPFSLGMRGESGGPMCAFVAGATPGGGVALLQGYGHGGPTMIPSGNTCAGGFVNLNSPVRLISMLTAGLNGKAEIGPAHVPLQIRGRVRLQALDLTTCATSNVARIVF